MSDSGGVEERHDDGEEGPSFLDGLISQETRRRTREQTQPFIDACCTPGCIRNSVLVSCVVALILTTLIVVINILHSDTAVVSKINRNDPPLWMLDQVTELQLQEHMRYLSSDLLEGRAPGTRGELLSTSYISSHFQAAGLRPLPSISGDTTNNEDDPYIQKVPMLGLTSKKDSYLSFGSVVYNFTVDFTADSETGETNIDQNYNVVFCGNCVFAPQFGINDFTNILDIGGKVVICLVNYVDPRATRVVDEYFFSFYYKLSYLRTKNVAGVLFVHTNSTGYSWEVFQNRFALGEQLSLMDYGGDIPIRFKGWIREEMADSIARMNGRSFEQWLKNANVTGNFRPQELSTQIRINVTFDIRPFYARNVIGFLGPDPSRFHITDPKTVVLMSHHDGLGIRNEFTNSTNSRIFNGAVDNASGTSALLASAYALGALYKDPFVSHPNFDPPSLLKTVVFVSTTADEYMLGQTYLLNNTIPKPVVTVVNYNIMNMWGSTGKTMIRGKNTSSLINTFADAAIAAENMQTKDMPPSPADEWPWPFAKDIPSIIFATGSDKDPNPILNYVASQQYTDNDNYTPSLSVSGMIQQIRLALRIVFSLSVIEDEPKVEY